MLQSLFSSQNFMPHGHCYLWNPPLIWTNVVTDTAIGLAYIVISLTLYTLTRRVKIPFSAMYLAFGVFIAACGLTHWMDVWTLWNPTYWLAAAVKVVTAVASVATAVILIVIRQKALALADERKLLTQHQTEIERERDFSKTLIESSLDGIFAFDKNLRYTAWNKAMSKFTGMNADQILGQSVCDVFPNLRGHERHKTYEQVLAGEHIYVQEQEFDNLYSGDRGFYFFEANWTPLFNGKGEVTGGLCVLRDITQRKRAETEIRDQQEVIAYSAKMATLGEMAGGIAHEINSPLNVISLSSRRLHQLVEQTPLPLDSISKVLRTLDDTTFRIAKIVKGLRLFARDGNKDPFEVASVKQIIEDTFSLCYEKFKNNGVLLISTEIDPEVEIECQAVQISQVILNLLSNAFDAVEVVQQKWIKVAVFERDGMVEISVQDSGPGIDPSIRDKIMEPFFTTKEVTKGTGLGLSISQGIVELHKGSLRFYSCPEGTKFVVRIPKASAEVCVKGLAI